LKGGSSREEAIFETPLGKAAKALGFKTASLNGWIATFER
jgi:hypothetical protein